MREYQINSSKPKQTARLYKKLNKNLKKFKRDQKNQKFTKNSKTVAEFDRRRRSIETQIEAKYQDFFIVRKETEELEPSEFTSTNQNPKKLNSSRKKSKKAKKKQQKQLELLALNLTEKATERVNLTPRTKSMTRNWREQRIEKQRKMTKTLKDIIEKYRGPGRYRIDRESISQKLVQVRKTKARKRITNKYLNRNDKTEISFGKSFKDRRNRLKPAHGWVLSKGSNGGSIPKNKKVYVNDEVLSCIKERFMQLKEEDRRSGLNSKNLSPEQKRSKSNHSGGELMQVDGNKQVSIQLNNFWKHFEKEVVMYQKCSSEEVTIENEGLGGVVGGEEAARGAEGLESPRNGEKIIVEYKNVNVVADSPRRVGSRNGALGSARSRPNRLGVYSPESMKSKISNYELGEALYSKITEIKE